MVANDELSELTRRYARFSRSAAGLGSVVGGVLALVAYFTGALAPLAPWSRLLLATTPLLWIGAKELLRHRYYQRFGRVVERPDPSHHRWHVALTIFIAVLSVGIVVVVVGGLIMGGWRTEPFSQWLGYLAFVVAMPFLVWRYMRTMVEFVVGVFLVAQAAVVLGGGNYELGQQLQAPVFAVVLIVFGVREHLEFRALARRLEGAGAGR